MKFKNPELKELAEKIRKHVRLAVSESRYEHSVRTAEMCKKLCNLYGLDEEIGYIAGLAHDMCKNLPEEMLLSICSRDGYPISDIEKSKPSLLHGRAAAVKLREDFDFHNEDVLEAIAWHTFGRVGMGRLGKILYAADKIEPGRDHITEEYLKKMYKLSLDDMIKKILQENIDYLQKKKRAVAEETLEFLQSL